jgi:hypothetical protein
MQIDGERLSGRRRFVARSRQQHRDAREAERCRGAVAREKERVRIDARNVEAISRRRRIAHGVEETRLRPAIDAKLDRGVGVGESNRQENELGDGKVGRIEAAANSERGTGAARIAVAIGVAAECEEMDFGGQRIGGLGHGDGEIGDVPATEIELAGGWTEEIVRIIDRC